MARVKLDLPEAWHFSTIINIRIGDINFAGHLAHDAILSLVHESRALLFHDNGWGELDVEGKGIVVADVVITYSNEAFFRDILRFDLSVTEFTKKGCDIYYRIIRVGDEKEIACAKTGIVFFDYEHRKPAEVPAGFLKRFI